MNALLVSSGQKAQGEREGGGSNRPDGSPSPPPCVRSAASLPCTMSVCAPEVKSHLFRICPPHNLREATAGSIQQHLDAFDYIVLLRF